MRSKIADWLARKLAVTAPIGVLPPGSDVIYRSEHRDGELSVLGNGDSLTVVLGKTDFTLVRIPPRAALQLGWFLLWRYWMRGTWCGLKLGLWYWAIGVKLDEAVREQKHGRQAKAQSVGS